VFTRPISIMQNKIWYLPTYMGNGPLFFFLLRPLDGISFSWRLKACFVGLSTLQSPPMLRHGKNQNGGAHAWFATWSHKFFSHKHLCHGTHRDTTHQWQRKWPLQFGSLIPHWRAKSVGRENLFINSMCDKSLLHTYLEGVNRWSKRLVT
jgi:hypothetical protein